MCTLFYIALYALVTLRAVCSDRLLPQSGAKTTETFATALFSESPASLPALLTNGSNVSASTVGMPTSNINFTTKITESPLKTTVVTQSPSPKSAGVAVITPQPPAGSSFNAGSFLGGMMLACILSLALMLGYKLVRSRRDVRYHTLDEHDAII